VKNQGRLVGKDELFELVWHGQIVEESNLTVHISAIRKALGEAKNNSRYITTIPGYGYRFDGKLLEARTDDGLIVETETLSRIVIERETENGAIDVGPALPAAAAALPGREVGLSQVSSATRRLNLRQVGAFAGLFVLLVIAIGGVWIYRAWTKSRSALGSPKQMTMRRFTTYGGTPYRVTISPDGKSLVYLQRFKDEPTMYLGQIDTNSSVAIYRQPDLQWLNPTFSPDGSSIYFMVGGDKRPRAVLARMSVIGGAITELIADVDSPVTCSPDGKRLAFIRRDGATHQTSIIIADAADGRNQHPLIMRGAPEDIVSNGLSWSPDGQSIAFGGRRADGKDEVVLVNLADGSTSKIGANWNNILNVTWLPDGSGVLVLSSANVGERLKQIWLVAFPGGEARKITNDLNSFLQSYMSVSVDGKLAVLQGHYNAEIWIAPRGDAMQARRVLRGVAPRYEGIDGLAWTPNGRLLYTAYVGGSEVIWSINGDGSDLRQLTPNRENVSDSNLSVTADNRYVVFQSNRSGEMEVWRVNTDGSDLRQLTTSANNSQPSLLPDGQWIIYLSGRDGKSRLWRMKIDGTDASELSDRAGSWPQVSPDGKYIAYLGSTGEQGTRLVIMPSYGGALVKSFTVPETALRAGRMMRWAPDSKSIFYRDGIQGLWQQDLDKESPQRIKGFDEVIIRSLAWSHDGANLAYASGPTTQEIILIENFK
jgi:TolB protein